jgi:hypothetical protein
MKKHVKRLFASFIEFLYRSKKTLLLILVVAALTLMLSAMISLWFSRINHLYLPSLGNIRTYGVEAYGGDIEIRDGEQYIDWGTVYPEMGTNRSFYVKSKSNVDSILIFEFVNWTFRDSNDKNVTGFIANNMSATCNCNGSIINPKDETYVTLTLSCGSSPDFISNIIDHNVQKFSFDICIYASKE